jgi:hypothetical protein
MAEITCGTLIRRAGGANILGTAGCLVQWPGKTDQLLLLTAARVLVGRTAEQFEAVEAIEAVDQPGKPIGCLYGWSDLQGPTTADVALVHVDPALVDAGIGPSGAAPKGTNLNPAVGDRLTFFADGKGHNLTITDFGDKTIDRVAPDSRASVNYLNQIICDPAMEDRCVGAMAMDGSNNIVGMVVGGDGRAFTLVTPIDALLSCTFGGPPGPALEVRTSVPATAKAPEKVTHPDHLGIQQIPAATEGIGSLGPGSAMRARWDGKTPHAADWSRFVMDALEQHGAKLLDCVPSDIRDFCPGFPDDKARRARFWLFLLSCIAEFESSFNPNATFEEPGELRGVTSAGLLQLSIGDARPYSCDFTTEQDILDPAKNLSCGVRIMQRWVVQDNVISGISDEDHKHKGGSRYWSTLRPGRKFENIKKRCSEMTF